MSTKAYIIGGLIVGVLAAIGNANKSPAGKAVSVNYDISKCLSGWDGSVRGSDTAIKSQLRDPDSYEHDQTVYDVSRVRTGRTSFVVKYRARNGFGGMNIAYAMGELDIATCQAVITNFQS